MEPVGEIDEEDSRSTKLNGRCRRASSRLLSRADRPTAQRFGDGKWACRRVGDAIVCAFHFNHRQLPGRNYERKMNSFMAFVEQELQRLRYFDRPAIQLSCRV